MVTWPCGGEVIQCNLIVGHFSVGLTQAHAIERKHTHLSGGAALPLLNGLPPEPDIMASWLLLQGWQFATGNKAGGNRTRWNVGECYHNHTAHDISEQPITGAC